MHTQETDSPHPLIKATFRKLKATKPDHWGMKRLKTTECLPVHTSDGSKERLLGILDTLVKAVGAEGGKVSVKEGYSAPYICMKVDGEEVSFDIREETERKPNNLSTKEREKLGWPFRSHKYLYEPSGRLLVSVHRVYGFDYPHAWRDRKNRRIEDCLGEVMESLHSAAAAIKDRRREDAAYEERRQEYTRREAVEQERIRFLDDSMAAWRQAKEIRAFLADVEAELRRTQSEPTRQFGQFLQWAKRYANKLDPARLKP